VEQARLHVIIEGRVQGVGFRHFVLEEAARLGLTGWVRNTWGRTVEVVAEGERPLLENLLARLHEGPRLARVEHLSVDWEAPRGEFTDFRVTG
jgi:acylphosphatase